MVQSQTHVGAELQVRLAADNLLVVRVIEVTVDDLLGKGEGLVETACWLATMVC